MCALADIYIYTRSIPPPPNPDARVQLFRSFLKPKADYYYYSIHPVSVVVIVVVTRVYRRLAHIRQGKQRG